MNFDTSISYTSVIVNISLQVNLFGLAMAEYDVCVRSLHWERTLWSSLSPHCMYLIFAEIKPMVCTIAVGFLLKKETAGVTYILIIVSGFILLKHNGSVRKV